MTEHRFVDEPLRATVGEPVAAGNPGREPLPPINLTFVRRRRFAVDEHDVQSLYVEQFWLPVIGPTATVLVRLLDRTLREVETAGHFTIPNTVLGPVVGIGTRGGRNSPLLRSLARLVQFDVLEQDAPERWLVPTTLPHVRGSRVARMPPVMGHLHELHLRSCTL